MKKFEAIEATIASEPNSQVQDNYRSYAEEQLNEQQISLDR